MEDVAALEAAIYDQSFRALDEQARVLDGLRARAGALVAGVSVATAFLGGLAGTTQTRRLDALIWAAIGLFVVVFCCHFWSRLLGPIGSSRITRIVCLRLI